MAIPNLIQYLNDYTNLRARIEGQKIELSDRGLFGAPFIYMTGYDAVVSLSETEIENLGEYLRNGGFLFVDDIAPNVDKDGNIGGEEANSQRGLKGTAFDQQMRAVLRKALGSEAKFQRIPKSHDIFHAFFGRCDRGECHGFRGNLHSRPLGRCVQRSEHQLVLGRAERVGTGARPAIWCQFDRFRVDAARWNRQHQ
jgi:hypothetical protein